MIDLEIFGAKDFVNNVIAKYGKSRDYNQLAITVHCETETGDKFTIVQFWNNRSVAHFMSA
jgi:hypothetical protein